MEDREYNQTVRQIREQRNRVGIAVFNTPEVSASCKLCNQRYISLENSTILFCKSCGDKRLAKVTKHADYKIRASYGGNVKREMFIKSLSGDRAVSASIRLRGINNNPYFFSFKPLNLRI